MTSSMLFRALISSLAIARTRHGMLVVVDGLDGCSAAQSPAVFALPGCHVHSLLIQAFAIELSLSLGWSAIPKGPEGQATVTAVPSPGTLSSHKTALFSRTMFATI